MKIINLTKNTVLAEDARMVDTFFRRIKGLLGRKDFRPREALIIKPCNSIHTFFMHFPIDVLFVDRHNRVIKTITALKPSRLTGIYFNATFAIELPGGTVESTSTSKADTLTIE